jgi:Arylsulfotransferase (ASST)
MSQPRSTHTPTVRIQTTPTVTNTNRANTTPTPTPRATYTPTLGVRTTSTPPSTTPASTIPAPTPRPTHTATAPTPAPTPTITRTTPAPTPTITNTTPAPTPTITNTTPAPTPTVTNTTPAPTPTVTNTNTPPAPNLISSSGLVNIYSPSTITSLAVSSSNLIKYGPYSTSSSPQTQFTITPSFSTTYQDYAVQTNLNNGSSMHYMLKINGTNLPISSINVDQAIQVYDSQQVYYIRFVNQNVPIANTRIYDSVSYTPGWYATASNSQGNYYSAVPTIYNQYGIPVWYMQGLYIYNLEMGLSADHLISNSVNPSYDGRITINSSNIAFNSFSSYAYDQHECLQIISPALGARYGNTIGFTGGSPFTINEYTSGGTLVWSWDASIYLNNPGGSSYYHTNSLDVHSTTGNILLSMRDTSDVLCIDYATKNVLWVLGNNIIQNLRNNIKSPTPSVFTNTYWISGSHIQNEPVLSGHQYAGTLAQHDARWHPEITPLYDSNNVVISIFDDQSPIYSNGQSGWPSQTGNARGVIYEINPTTGVAYNISNVVSPYGCSPYRGSFTVLQELTSFSHTIDCCQYSLNTNGGATTSQNGTVPFVLEYKGPIQSNNINSKPLVFDMYFNTNSFLGGNYGSYRCRKMPLSFFTINKLRATAGMSAT